MTSIKTMTADADSPNADRVTALYSDNQGIFAIFGRLEGAEFIVSCSQPSRSYKTLKGAERAASRWNNS
jgi:hypothetical protein